MTIRRCPFCGSVTIPGIERTHLPLCLGSELVYDQAEVDWRVAHGLLETSDPFFAFCLQCCARGPHATTEQEAFDMWWTRTPVESVPVLAGAWRRCARFFRAVVLRRGEESGT